MWFLLAEQTKEMDGLSWFSSIIQLGSFGLLAYLIIYGLPALHKEIIRERQSERTDFVRDLKEQRADFTSALKEVSKVFRDEAAAERLACEKHFETLAGAMKSGSDATMAAIKTSAEQIQQHALRNQQWAKMLEAETEKARAAMDLAKQAQENRDG